MNDAIGKPQLEVVGDVYRFSWPCGIEAELDRFSEHRDELTGELLIRSSRPPSPGLIHGARFNLMSTTARKTLAGALRDRDADLDWPGLLEQLCFLARERYREGEPSIDLREHVRSPLGRWLLEPFIERDGPTILFADGGTGKSLLAIAMAITVAGGAEILGALHGEPGPVLYLDWETDPDTAQERLDATLAGAELLVRPPVIYRRMSSSLMEAASNLRRDVAQHGIRLVIVDPLGNARGGEPESADVTIRLFNAARSLGVPWLGVDHVSKAAGNDSTRPFGSTYTHNGARITWGVDKAQDEGENAMVISLTNHKRNNGRRLSRLGYRIAFETGHREELLSVRYRRTDLTQVPGLAEKMPIKQRIMSELRSGPSSISDLAEQLGIDVRVASSRAGELVKRGLLVKLEDKRVALAAGAD